MADLKTRGDALNMATAGLGSAANLCALLVQQAAGSRATIVVFRGTAPAIAELDGRADRPALRPGDQHHPLYPRQPGAGLGGQQPAAAARPARLPTTTEAGFGGVAMSTWHGLYAPAGTPEPIQEKLSAALQAALREDKLRQRYAELLTDVPSPERRDHRLPPPLSGRGGGTLAAHHPGRPGLACRLNHRGRIRVTPALSLWGSLRGRALPEPLLCRSVTASPPLLSSCAWPARPLRSRPSRTGPSRIGSTRPG